MEVKKQVRRRRHERLRQLVEHKDAAGHDPYLQEVRFDPEQPQRTLELELDADKLHDPEYVWKQRQTRLLLDSKGVHQSRDFPSQPPRSAKLRSLRTKLFICLALFAVLWILFRVDQPWAVTAQAWVRSALSEDFDFRAAAAGYAELFQGAPSFIPTFGLGERNQAKKEAQKVFAEMAKGFFPPVSGRIQSGFSEESHGMKVQANQAHAPIVALDEGRVIYVGNQAETGFTVMLQHPNHVKSIYGNIEKNTVQENDWVQAGQQIAVATSLYFSIQMDDDYINPADVISFD